MSDYINEALLDASPYKKQQEEAKGLVSKWDKTGLLDGLNEDFQKNGMAVMLENQARQLINENSSTGGGSLWYHTEYGRTFVYYDEVTLGIGNTAVWVDAAPFNQGPRSAPAWSG